jgi:nicotinate-nucleotide adenylyltransferase
LAEPRVVLLGGSFDPPHDGHLAIARAALAAGFDEVVLLPVALSPHKLTRPPAPAMDRYTMCVLATLDEPRIIVSRHELEMPPPSYSVDTAQHFRRERPDASYWWAIGADNLEALLTWMRVDDFVNLARFLVVPRGDMQGAALQEKVATLPEWIKAAMDLLDMPTVDVSSTEVRRLVRAGKIDRAPLRGVVARYITRYGLYYETPVWQTGHGE